MTVSVDGNRRDYNGDGTTVAFAFPYPTYADADLSVYVTNSSGVQSTLTLNVDYTIAGAGGASCTVTLTSGSLCATGETLTILRILDRLQSTDWVDGEIFTAASMETRNDKTALITQQLQEQLDRSFHFPPGTNVSGELPASTATTRGGAAIGFNAAGTALSLITGVGSTPISSSPVSGSIPYWDYTIHRVGSLTSLKALTGIVTGFPVYMTGRTSQNDGGEGIFRWNPSDLSAEVAADTLSGIYAPPASDTTGASGAWERLRDQGLVNPAWFGLKNDGTTDGSSIISAAASMLSDNGIFVIYPGNYIWNDGQSSAYFDGLNNITISGYGAKTTQPLQTTSLGGASRKSMYFINCTNVTIEGISFYGRHLSYASGSDNSNQAAISLQGCSDCTIKDCYAENFYYGFIVSTASQRIIVDSCKTKTTRYAFYVVSATDVIVCDCISYGAHYYPAGVDAVEKASGSGFLAVTSTRVTFDSCIGIESGSDGFRSQGVDAQQLVTFKNCKDINGRRYGMSLRGGGYSSIDSCEIINLGDSSIWDGSEWYEPYSAIGYGVVIDATSADFNGVSNTDIGCADLVGAGIHIDEDNDYLKINGNRIVIESGLGISVGSSASKFGSMEGNTIYVTTATTANYGISVLPGNDNWSISNNTINGAYDGILSYSDDSTLVNNRIFNCQRHGINQNGNRCVISENNVSIVGTVTTGYGIRLNAANNILGPNIVSDTQGVPTMVAALRLEAAATGTMVGPVQEYATSTGVSRVVAIADDALPLFMKAAADADSVAADVATLKADHNDLLAKLRAAGLVDQ